MTLLAFIMIFIGVLVGCPVAWFEIQRKHRFPYITMAVILPILFLMAFSMNHQENVTVNNAELVAIVEDDQFHDHEIYYDAESDQYFRKDISEWNPFKMFYRTELDREEVEGYLEYQEKLQSINLLD